MATTRRVIPFAELGRQDVGRVGGKNASLGEMTAHLAAGGVRVPPGFATTAYAYGELLGGHGLRGRIDEQLGRIHEAAALEEVAVAIRAMILAEPLPAELCTEIVSAYEQLAREQGRDEPEVAVRSSATAEDLPEASFAGQQETYLNVRGPARLLEASSRRSAVRSPRSSPASSSSAPSPPRTTPAPTAGTASSPTACTASSCPPARPTTSASPTLTAPWSPPTSTRPMSSCPACSLSPT